MTGHEPIDPDLVASSQSRRDRAGVMAAIAVGGALGAPARYGLSTLVGTRAGAFPWATFWVNVSGSAALGFLVAWLIAHGRDGGRRRALLGTGFLGAYTTYSTFAVETDQLLQHGRAGVAVAYAGASVVAGLAAAAVGLSVGRRLA
ncbi:MAG: fluoride exporter [Actinomycetota bacterium]|nr:fluoride exporter [Actinomycetota bacterium]